MRRCAITPKTVQVIMKKEKVEIIGRDSFQGMTAQGVLIKKPDPFHLDKGRMTTTDIDIIGEHLSTM
jgi:hypothetical protein